jgi:hypothetical protein
MERREQPCARTHSQRQTGECPHGSPTAFSSRIVRQEAFVSPSLGAQRSWVLQAASKVCNSWKQEEA